MCPRAPTSCNRERPEARTTSTNRTSSWPALLTSLSFSEPQQGLPAAFRIQFRFLYQALWFQIPVSLPGYHPTHCPEVRLPVPHPSTWTQGTVSAFGHSVSVWHPSPTHLQAPPVTSGLLHMSWLLSNLHHELSGTLPSGKTMSPLWLLPPTSVTSTFFQDVCMCTKCLFLPPQLQSP